VTAYLSLYNQSEPSTALSRRPLYDARCYNADPNARLIAFLDGDVAKRTSCSISSRRASGRLRDSSASKPARPRRRPKPTNVCDVPCSPARRVDEVGIIFTATSQVKRKSQTVENVPLLIDVLESELRAKSASGLVDRSGRDHRAGCSAAIPAES